MYPNTVFHAQGNIDLTGYTYTGIYVSSTSTTATINGISMTFKGPVYIPNVLINSISGAPADLYLCGYPNPVFNSDIKGLQ